MQHLDVQPLPTLQATVFASQRRLVRGLSITLLLGTLAACSPAPEAEAGTETAAQTADVTAPPPKTTALTVQVLTATSGKLEVERRVTADIQSSRQSDVAAETGGVLLSYAVAEGDSVGQGEVVATLDDTDARQAVQNAREQVRQAEINLNDARARSAENSAPLSASVDSARSSLASAQAGVQTAQASLSAAQDSRDTAQRDLNTAQQLYAAGAISLQELNRSRDTLSQAQSGLQQAQGSLAQAQSQVQSAQAGLSRAQADAQSNATGTGSNTDLLEAQLATARTNLAQAQERLTRTQVLAPFGGVVSKHLVQPGEFAAQGGAVFTLVDTQAVRARFSVPPEEAASLTAGTRMNLDYGGKNYVAIVEGGERIAGDDRLVLLEARVQGGEAIPLGASATLRYTVNLGDTGAGTSAGTDTLIPSRALQVAGGESYVYVAEGGQLARRVPVQVVAEADGKLAVKGVEAGDQLIYPVPSSLRDGSKVQVEAGAAADEVTE